VAILFQLKMKHKSSSLMKKYISSSAFFKQKIYAMLLD
jgi:hypothetical protein